MLNTIKSMLTQKMEMMESAELLGVSGRLDRLSESVILGESAEDLIPTFLMEDGEIPTDPKATDSDASTELPNDDLTTERIEEDDKLDPDIAPNEKPEDKPEEAEDPEDLMHAPIEDPNELPTPIGRQTGEPINPENDLLTTEIDLTSNTPRDTIPVPPKHVEPEQVVPEDHSDDLANEPVEAPVELSDEQKANPTMNQLADLINQSDGHTVRVDQLKELLRENGILKSEGDPFQEAITIGDPVEDSNGGDTNANPAPEGDTTSTPTEDTPPTDNIVTAAVKDKVAESEEPIADNLSGGETDSNKDAILKKLGAISKSIEDAKRAVIDMV